MCYETRNENIALSELEGGQLRHVEAKLVGPENGSGTHHPFWHSAPLGVPACYETPNEKIILIDPEIV
jgi:hypothetical protein